MRLLIDSYAEGVWPVVCPKGRALRHKGHPSTIVPAKRGGSCAPTYTAPSAAVWSDNVVPRLLAVTVSWMLSRREFFCIARSAIRERKV